MGGSEFFGFIRKKSNGEEGNEKEMFLFSYEVLFINYISSYYLLLINWLSCLII